MALANKLALVTGGASGIGLAVAKAFSLHGANVVLVDQAASVLESAAALGARATGRVCDVSDSGQVARLFREIEASFPEQRAPSVVVNSAGIVRDSVLLKMSEADFDKVIAVNLKGTYLVTQAAGRGLVQLQTSGNGNVSSSGSGSSNGGSIINVSSIVAKFGNIGQANYAASKAGVEGLTRTTARELGRYRIRCNAILPGFIKTPMTDKLQPKHLEQMLRMVPLGRIGSPDDIAQLALFLASDASAYMTGSSIECAGGLSF